MTEEAEKNQRSKWLDFGILLASVPILLASLRILIFSGGDPVLMKVLVETLDIQTLLLGTVLPVLPMVLVPILQPLIYDGGMARKLMGTESKQRLWWFLAVAILVSLFVLLGPYPSALRTVRNLTIAILAGVLSTYVLFSIRALIKKESLKGVLRSRFYWGSESSIFRPIHLLMGPVVFLTVVFAQPSTMWLPLEQMVVKGQSHNGYVLEESGNWVTMLGKDKSVMRAPSASISKRVVCDQGKHTSLLIIWFGDGDASVPKCQ